MLDAFAVAGDWIAQAGPVFGELLETTGDAAAEEAGQRAVGGAAAGGLALWKKLRGRAETTLPGGAGRLDMAVAAAAADPEDQSAFDALHESVGRILSLDEDLLQQVAEWSAAVGDYAGPRAVQTRDVSNSAIITGDNNRIG